MADKTELQYTAEHEWVLVDGDTALVGITAYAADKLGDVVSISTSSLGTLSNTVNLSTKCPPWTYGSSHLLRDLAKADLL